MRVFNFGDEPLVMSFPPLCVLGGVLRVCGFMRVLSSISGHAKQTFEAKQAKVLCLAFVFMAYYFDVHKKTCALL